MLGEIVEVRVDCCNNSTTAYHLIYDPDNQNFLSIDRGTPVICGDCVGCGSYPLLVEITETDDFPPAPEGTEIVAAYECLGYKGGKLCSHVTFGKPIVLLLKYDPDALDEDVASVFIARYNPELGEWEPLPPTGGVAAIGELGVFTSMFSTFAVIAELSQPSPPEPPAPPPSPTPEPPPPPLPPAHFVASGLNITTDKDVTGIGNMIFVIKAGESVKISANVANDGGQSGDYAAVLRINGETKSTREITLGPGQGQELVFNIASLKPGKYVAQIDDLTGEFTVVRWTNWPLIAGLATAFGLLVWAIWYLVHRRRREVH
jgi:hypothetical protein